MKHIAKWILVLFGWLGFLVVSVPAQARHCHVHYYHGGYPGYADRAFHYGYDDGYYPRYYYRHRYRPYYHPLSYYYNNYPAQYGCSYPYFPYGYAYNYSNYYPTCLCRIVPSYWDNGCWHPARRVCWR